MRSGMKEECLAAVKIDQDLCSRCKVCYSLCPFDAIGQSAEDNRIRIDIQKCQVCGICYSACPVSAIEMAYYTVEDLMEQVLARVREDKARTLVVMCRGNSLSRGELEELLVEQGLESKDYVQLRVPCAGRIPTDLLFSALQSGVQNILSVQCQDGFCRMKEGTAIETRRLLLGKAVAQQLGYPEDTFKVVKYSRKAVWINDECVGCDKCVFVCPYEAIIAEPFSSPTVVQEKCVGCGACQMVCPHSAIQVKGFEFERVLTSYCDAAAKMKADGRRAVLVLSCQWSEFSALDDPEALRGKNAMVLEVPCIKGLDPVHVVKAFQRGFDGVMAIVCPEKDCKLQKGRDTAERQVEVLRKYLKALKLQDRFEIHELSPRCEGEFVSKFDAFREKVAKMPPVAISEKEV